MCPGGATYLIAECGFDEVETKSIERFLSSTRRTSSKCNLFSMIKMKYGVFLALSNNHTLTRLCYNFRGLFNLAGSFRVW